MRSTLRLAVAAIVLLVSATVGVVTAVTAHADTVLCDQYGSTPIQGRYVVQNNRWGASTNQCITVTGTGFTVSGAEHANPTNGPPAAYPSVYLGCHYTNCSPGSPLPARVRDITAARSSVSYGYAAGTYNASYDIWLDPAPRTDGQNATEIMIWFDRQGPVQPIGAPVGTTTIGGRSWEVWQGNIGWTVISYVAPSRIDAWDFDVLDFVGDVRARGAVTDDWYLTSVQAGFEPWVGGAGLAVRSFSASVERRGATPPPSSPPPASPPPASPPPSGGGAGSCDVDFRVKDDWGSGYVGEVTLTNTGTAPVSDWTAGFTLPGGQVIDQWWSAEFGRSGAAVTVRPVEWNRTLAPGASTTFGYRATGSAAAPGGFSLNGRACAT